MLQITCPWCGAREEPEFTYGGEADIPRPPDPATLSEAEWGAYLFMKRNAEGRHHELWLHAAGCRRWFRVERNTLTYEILAVRPLSATASVEDR